MTEPPRGRSAMFHVGIVVPNLEEAQRRFTDLLGLQWGPRFDIEAPFYDREGRDIGARLKFAYSTEPPYLELIQEQPGTPWVCNEHSNLHHIGFYADDVPAQSARLEEIRCPFVLRLCPAPDDPPIFAVHRDDLGVCIELASEVLRSGMEDVYFTPTPLDAPVRTSA
jgi:catechol 2,3-dioxygenase-like lactoylglutathione lyase family enzyme